MSQINNTRSGCKDVFHAFMVESASYEGELEIPRIAPEELKPDELVSFTKAIRGADPEAWIHFYEDDASFERLWNRPNKYLPLLLRHRGVIAPDFSLYRDMPLVMQYWNVYRSHAVAVWLQRNGVPTIANVRWGDRRTFGVCCAGVPHNSSIAVGSHGCMKLAREREFFANGLAHIVQALKPRTIIVYGAAPDSVFGQYKASGIDICQFDSEYMITHRKAVDA